MTQMWKPQPIEVYKTWLDTVIYEAGDMLNSWESSFISDIENQLLTGRNLTERQAEVLERIYTEKTK